MLSSLGSRSSSERVRCSLNDANHELTSTTERYLLALKCLLASSKIDRSHYTVHEQIVRYKLAIDSASSSLKSQTADVIKAEFTLLPSSTTLSDYNSSFLLEHKDSPRHIYATLRVKQLLPSKDQSKNEQDVLATLDLAEITLEEGGEGLDLLISWKSNQTEAFKAKATLKWPQATVFQTSAKN